MPRTLLAAFGVGLVAAFAVLGMRASIEASYRDVEIVLDGPDWEALAIREGADPLAYFARAREHGHSQRCNGHVLFGSAGVRFFGGLLHPRSLSSEHVQGDEQ